MNIDAIRLEQLVSEARDARLLKGVIKEGHKRGFVPQSIVEFLYEMFFSDETEE